MEEIEEMIKRKIKIVYEIAERGILLGGSPKIIEEIRQRTKQNPKAKEI